MKGKLDPRVRRTRQLLEGAFLELIEEKSLQSITVRDITDRATINRTTFYAHFEDKYVLFDHVVRASFRQALQSRLPEAAELSADNLRSLILAVCEFLAQLAQSCASSDDQVRPLVEAQVQTQLYELLLDWIEQLSVQGGDGPGSPEIAAAFSSWAIFGVGLQWSRDPSLGSPEKVADQVISLITQGHMLGSLPAEEPLPAFRRSTDE
jgi:AcrR family transcriptional regulator